MTTMKMQILGTLCVSMMAGACMTGTTGDEVTVTLEPRSELMRSLPTLASGKTTLLGQAVPDSHGSVTYAVNIEGATQVRVQDLALDVVVDGEPLEIEIQRLHVGDQDVQEGALGTLLQDGDVVQIDYRAKQLGALVQPEGAEFAATASLDWEATDLGSSWRDTATARTSEVVEAAVNTGTFELRMDRPMEAHALATTKAKLRASVEVTNGLTVSIGAVKIQAVYFGAGALPALGLALVDQPARQMNGAAATSVAPGQVLDLYTSSSPMTTAAPYTEAGLAASTGSVTGGKALVTVEINYTPAGMPPATDTVAFVTDVP